MRRLCVTLAVVAYVWIIVLAYTTDLAPKPGFQERWTQCMTEQRSYVTCEGTVR